MPATERLYYNDSHLIEFEARVVDTSERVSGWTAITLDRTAFYPTGGGQPSDTGTINGLRVVECIDDEANGVLHVIQGRPPEIGATVKGRVDWLRRLDHIQQHTGQHILSQAFVTLFNAPTKGFRVLDGYCEIDVELANPSAESIERAVELANNVIWEDRTITIQTVSSQAAAGLPLRKDPSREGDLRLIEIDGFDLTPCGGTHAFRTGEVGMIAVRSWERAKGLTRIEFVAGMRALADYRRANKTARDVAALFSCARDDASSHASHSLEENKELHRRVRVLEEIAARAEAEELLRDIGSRVMTDSLAISRDSSPEVMTDSLANSRDSNPEVMADSLAQDLRSSASTGGMKSVPSAIADGSVTDNSSMRIVQRLFIDRDAESLKRLALALISHPRTIALLGSHDKEAARLVFARSADAAGDMNELMKEACAMLDGRGGGKPELAQGGGKNLERLSEAIDQAAASLGARV